MGQEPNIRLGVEDLPRATAKPGVPDGWSPGRPGEIGSPEEMPWGGAFGTPGPDIGFAHRIVRGMDLPGDRETLEPIVIAVMAARASAVGRAPTAKDAAMALDLIAERDPESLAALARDRAQLAEFIAAIPREKLVG